MDVINFLTELPTAAWTVVGAVVGGSIAAGVAVFLDFRKAKREDKTRWYPEIRSVMRQLSSTISLAVEARRDYIDAEIPDIKEGATREEIARNMKKLEEQLELGRKLSNLNRELVNLTYELMQIGPGDLIMDTMNLQKKLVEIKEADTTEQLDKIFAEISELHIRLSLSVRTALGVETTLSRRFYEQYRLDSKRNKGEQGSQGAVE